MRGHDDRNQPGRTNRAEPRRCLEDPDDRVLLRFPEQVALDLLLLLDEEARLRVERRCSQPGTRRKPLLPLLSVSRAVDREARDQDAPRAVETLDPRLDPNDFLHHGDVHPRELAKRAELPGRLEDPLLERPRPQLLRQTVGIPPVALLTPTLGDPRDDDLVDVGTQRLVEPGTLDAFLEDPMLATRNPPDRLDQRMAVGLDREVREPLARLRNDRERAARSMDVQSQNPFPRCLLSLGIVASPTRGSSAGSGGTSSLPPRDSRTRLQTPYPYDAYAPARSISSGSPPAPRAACSSWRVPWRISRARQRWGRGRSPRRSSFAGIRNRSAPLGVVACNAGEAGMCNSGWNGGVRLAIGSPCEEISSIHRSWRGTRSRPRPTGGTFRCSGSAPRPKTDRFRRPRCGRLPMAMRWPKSEDGGRLLGQY